MDPQEARRLQLGQAEAWDRDLAALLVERLQLSAEEAHELRKGCEPGMFAAVLIRKGRLSQVQLEELRDEISRRGDRPQAAVPDEVREASGNTLARVGRYIRIHVIGRGGMGEVWKAWDGQLYRWVALKFLPDNVPQLTQRFFREAQLASQLSHPGITRIYEIFSVPTGTYIAMEFVDGPSLEGARRERRRAATIVRDAARAVQHAHVHGVIHRDLKPGNLLEAKDGRVFVADFGLARPIAPGGTLTLDGAILGTPSYMAPEQAVGRPVSCRTDVYGLGATLFTLIEGRPPIEGKTPAEILRRVVEESFPCLGLRDDLAGIVRKAAEREPQDRYASAAELADDLDRYLAGESIRARPVGAVRKLARRVRRHPVLAMLLLVGVAVLAGGVYFGTGYLRERRARAREARADGEIQKARRALADLYALSSGAGDPELREAALRELDLHTEAALAHAPDYPPALCHRGIALLYRDRSEEAVKLFTRILERDPAQQDARRWRAEARLFSGDLLLPQVEATPKGVRLLPSTRIGKEEEEFRAASEDIRLLPAGSEEREFGEALLAFARADYASARTLLEKAKSGPHRLRTLLFLAYAELACGRFAEAEDHARRLVRAGLFCASDVTVYARASRGDLAGAVEEAGRLLEGPPQNPLLRACRALWLFTLERLEESRKEYDRLIRESPDKAEHRINLSRVFQRLGDRKQAMAEAEEACRLAPGNPWALLRRAHLLPESEEAVAAYSQVLAIDDSIAEAHALRAARLWDLGKAQEAVAGCRRAVELEPSEPRWRKMLALFYREQRDFTGALEEFTRLLHLLPQQPDLYLERAAVRQDLGDGEGATNDIKSAEELASHLLGQGRTDASLFETRAHARNLLLRTEEAIQDMTEAITRNPGNPKLRYPRANWLCRLGRYEEALPDYECLITVYPEDAIFHAYRGRALFSLGRWGAALNSFEKAVALEPKLRETLEATMKECRKKMEE